MKQEDAPKLTEEQQRKLTEEYRRTLRDLIVRLEHHADETESVRLTVREVRALAGAAFLATQMAESASEMANPLFQRVFNP
jgi:hypothetical protein